MIPTIFGPSTGRTYEDLKRQQQLANALRSVVFGVLPVSEDDLLTGKIVHEIDTEERVIPVAPFTGYKKSGRGLDLLGDIYFLE